MNKKIKFSIAFVVLVVVLQLVPVDRSNRESLDELKEPENVKLILKKGCYDCHSNHTNWPKYSYIFPLSVIISFHVHEGREELNFSNWESLTPKKQVRNAAKINEAISEGEMPIFGYTFTHPEAVLTKEEKEILIKWEESLEEKYHLPKESTDSDKASVDEEK